MNLKIAAMLIVSVFMSANTSYAGDLLDRMLGRAGCSSCAAPAAKGCGGGGLLDRLMSGCSSKCDSAEILNVDSSAGCGCEAAAPSCGCDAAPAVEASPCGCDAAPAVEASPCGCDGATVVATSPCGCEAAPMVEASPCGCDAAPAVEASPCGCDGATVVATSPCGCDAAPMVEAAPVVEASPCGCDAAPAVAASPCGCDAAPMVEASPCGCDAAPAGGSGGLLDRLASMRRGCSSAPAVAASPCGCDAAPAIESPLAAFEASPAMASPFAKGGCASNGGGCSGFLSRLRGMSKGLCNSAPAAAAAHVAQVSSCGCDAAPAVAASHVAVSAPAVSSGCGCNAAPAVSTCGCNAPAGGCGSAGGCATGHSGGRPKLTLLDRLKGNRIARDRDGRVIGVSNDGCNPPCPQEPAPCGCNAHVEAPYVVEAAPCSSCSTCGGGEVIYSDAVPVEGCANGVCGSTPIYGDVVLPSAAAATAISDDSDASEGSGSRVDPVVPDSTQGTLQGVQEEVERRDVTQPSVSDEENDPIVDPGAFVPRATNTFGS